MLHFVSQLKPKLCLTLNQLAMDTMHQLPQDVVTNILSRLPVKNLMQLKCVCKPWQSLVSDPHLAKLHLARSKNENLNSDRFLLFTGSPDCVESLHYVDDLYRVDRLEYPEVMKKIHGFDELVSDLEVGGFCDGLICVSFSNGRGFLWNPAIRVALELPNDADPNDYLIYGVGYDSAIDDYKVLRGRRHPSRGNHYFEILTLKTNTWRKIEVEECYLEYHFRELPGIFLRGALHWLAYSFGNFDSKNSPVILAFDFVEERFRKLVELPDSIKETMLVDLVLTNSGDSLILFFATFNYLNLEAWQLNEYGIKYTWTKIFSKYGCSIPNFRHWGRVLHYTETGKIIFDYGNKGLVSYDPKEYKWIVVTLENNSKWFRHAIYS